MPAVSKGSPRPRATRTPAQRKARRRPPARATLEQRARARKQAEILLAREDPSAFIEYVVRHEKTRRRIRNTEFHKAWQRHLTEHEYAVLIEPVEHGKTQQVGIGRILWELGRQPTLRIGLISNTVKQAAKLLKQIRQYIEESSALREVFPELRRSRRKSELWHSTALTVERDSFSKDPSIQALGVFGPIVGSRLDIVLLDDILDFENTRTKDQRAKVIEWIDTEVFTRCQDEPGAPPAKLWAIGTPWHPEDLLHDLAARPDFHLHRMSAVHNPDAPEADWRPVWPEQWPLARLLRRKRNTSTGGATTFVRKFLCRVRMDATSRFRETWIAVCSRLGRGRTLLPTAPRRPSGQLMPCFTGVDLGVGQKKADALTSLFTLALDERKRRVVVNVESGQWQGPEIVQRIVAHHRRYNSICMVESVGAQKYLVQFAQIEAAWVRPFMTGANKWDEEFGVESLAVEMELGLWVIPSGSSGKQWHPEVSAWISEMLHFDPEKHTGDRLMASWFAREALRQFQAPRSGNVDTQRR